MYIKSIINAHQNRGNTKRMNKIMHCALKYAATGQKLSVIFSYFSF